jgi:hypothetical protein
MNISLSQKFKEFANDENKTMLIGLLTILVFIWLVIYLIPSFFVSLFDTFLGRIILVFIVILVGLNNYRYGLMLGLILIIFTRFVDIVRINASKNGKENFELLSKLSTLDFLNIQHTINPRIVFDMEIIKKQASQLELDYFLKNGMWPWSQDVIDLYTEAINKNKFIRTYSGDSINYTRKIYNQAAILQLLAMETKEGSFLISGVEIHGGPKNDLEDLPSGYGDFGYQSGLKKHMNQLIKCNIDDNGNASLEKTEYTGTGGIFGEQTSKKSPVDYNNLESEIPGFKFLNGPCDPCKAMNSTPDYSCPYSLDIKGSSSGVSSVWKYLWGNR